MRQPSLRIQSVLYGNKFADVIRASVAMARACELAQQAGQLGRVCLGLGDSSSLPALQMGQLDHIRERVLGQGIDEVTYDYFGANLGSAGGHNRLLEALSHDLLLIANPDVVADPALIRELMLPLVEPLVGVVEAKQLPLEHPKPYDRTTGETPWVTTACALTRRAVVEQVGGFDAESFFLYCDDVDWSWRVRLAGYRLIMQPAAKVFHDKRIDAEGHLVFGDSMVYYSAEAALFMFHKYSRPDLVSHYLNVFEANSSERPLEAKAARSFRQRQNEGRLPAPLDADGTVATFVDGQYAQHRF